MDISRQLKIASTTGKLLFGQRQVMHALRVMPNALF